MWLGNRSYTEVVSVYAMAIKCRRSARSHKAEEYAQEWGPYMALVSPGGGSEVDMQAKSGHSSIGTVTWRASAARTEGWGAVGGRESWTETEGRKSLMETEGRKEWVEIVERRDWTASEGMPERTSSYFVS